MPGELEFLESEQQGTYKSRQIIGNSVEPGLIKWLTDHKVVKSPKAAARVLTIASVIMILVALGLVSDWRFFVIPHNPKVGEGIYMDLGDGRGIREIPPDTRVKDLQRKNQS